MPEWMFHVALAVSVTGLLLLAFISPSVKPPPSRVCDISGSSVGKAVYLSGNVSEVHAFKGGSKMLTLSEYGCTVDVFMSPDIGQSLANSTLVGRRLDVLGEVQLYKGRVEVSVDKPGAVILK